MWVYLVLLSPSPVLFSGSSTSFTEEDCRPMLSKVSWLFPISICSFTSLAGIGKFSSGNLFIALQVIHDHEWTWKTAELIESLTFAGIFQCFPSAWKLSKRWSKRCEYYRYYLYLLQIIKFTLSKPIQLLWCKLNKMAVSQSPCVRTSM